MLTRRKSSEMIEPSLTKKVKVESNLKEYIENKQTRLILRARGIKTLFAIQQQCYKPIYDGEDLIGQDRTGSGKTLAYCLPLIERLRDLKVFEERSIDPKVLILLPTRELAIQVSTEVNTLKHEDKEFKVSCVYGGTDLRTQIHQLRQGCDIVIGTPGRTIDLLERGTLKLNNIVCIVLDEADQMLNFGFQEDIERIFRFLKDQSKLKQQMLLFSATIPSWVKQLSAKYQQPQRKFVNLIKLGESQASTTVKHYSMACAREMMIGSLGDVVSVYGGRHCRTIIFCETKRDANEIILKAKLPFEAQPLHGDIPQQQRTVTFEAFKSGKVKCLIATNVASRGLDFPQVDLIIQCSPPKDIDTYIHRAGRTARAGKTGVCITFYNKRDAGLIQRIERMAKIKFLKITAPQHSDIIQASSRDLSLSLKGVSQEIVSLFEPVAEQLMSEFNPTEALARALACVSGFKDKLKTRSMLGSFEGFITYILRSPTQFRVLGFIWSVLRANFSETIVSSIKGMKKLLNDNGVAFDIPEEVKEEFDAVYQNLVDSGKFDFTIEQAVTLPEIVEETVSQYNTGYGGGQQAYGRQQYGNGYGRGGRGEESQVPQAVKKETEVFIGGIDSKSSEKEIADYFQKEGVEFIQLRTLRDEDGNFKGVAFGLCKDRDGVQKAIGMNGSKWKGRPLRINMADQKPSR